MADEPDYTPSHTVCPKCGKLMRLIAVEPSEAVLGVDEITYRCPFCDHEEKRIRTTPEWE